MPTRTEVIISIGEVLECLPPGKTFRRKRYGSFDANQLLEAGNEENVAPLSGAGARCDPASIGMKSRENGVADTELEPKVLPVRRKTRGSEDGTRQPAEQGEEDDEVTFHPDTVSAIAENGNSLSNGDESASKKAKRKSSAEKFLEDNASYFQLEVLATKTRSSKTFEANGEGQEKEGFHNSFLDFLKSKGVEGKDDSDSERSRARHRSGPSGGATKQSRKRASSCHQSPTRSDSEDSVRPQRSRSHVTKSRTRRRPRSRSRDFSPSESEQDFPSEKSTHQRSTRKVKSVKMEDSSDDESASEGSYTKSTRSRTRGGEPASSPSPSKRSRRSELDKLLEAVDTSFHYETAAAAAKRIGGSAELGPLEIDVSDSNMESGDEEDEETNFKKRKHSESEAESADKRKKIKGNNGNLLKTFSPTKKEDKDPPETDEEVDESEPLWDGWETLHETLASTDSAPVDLKSLHFSFEVTPHRESWFQTYSRQDRGEDVVFYPETKTFPFPLPYELPYSTFMPYKPEAAVKVEEKTKKKSKKTEDPPVVPPLKGKKKKVSECDSTDSENNKKGKPKFGPKTDHLLDLHPRISPRCHASTKAILHGGTLTDEELAEALLFQDERDIPYPSYAPFLSQDETSNDSMSSSTNTRHCKRESVGDYLQIASSMDRYLRNTEGLTETDLAAAAANKPGKDRSIGDKVPTRSRVSSEELLKNLKDKPKRKKDKVGSSEVILDQVVADHVDGVLLEYLEDELPTIPFVSEASEVLNMLDTYQNCNSMNVCNSRWLRPSRPSGLSSQKDGVSKHFFGSKPKRLVIYKEDLPGFKYDNDIETEKLPVSKRFLAKATNVRAVEDGGKASAPKKESPSTKKGGVKKEVFIARKEKVKEESEDDDSESVASSVSTTSSSRNKEGKFKKKLPKTDIPSAKKKSIVKRRSDEAKNDNAEKPKSSEKKKVGHKKAENKPTVSRQLKMDKFITKTKTGKSGSRADASSLGRRSTTMSKNYSEIESDTESVFESKVPYRSPHMKLLKPLPKSKPKHK